MGGIMPILDVYSVIATRKLAGWKDAVPLALRYRLFPFCGAAPVKVYDGTGVFQL